MSDTEKKVIKVELYGKTFKVRSDDEEYLQSIAGRIDDLMQIIGRGKQPFDISLVLASLTLGDELAKAEEKIKKYEESQKRLIDSLDAAFDDDSQKLQSQAPDEKQKIESEDDSDEEKKLENRDDKEKES